MTVNAAIEDKIAQCTALVAEQPNDAQLHLKLGVYYLQRDTQKISDGVCAEQHISRAISLGCGSAFAFFHLGLAVRMQGKGGCDHWFREAIRLDPGHYVARQFLAHEHLIEGDLKSAQRELRAASALAPEDREIQNDLHDIEAILSEHKQKVNIARWPAKLSDFADLDQCIGKHVLQGVAPTNLFNGQSKICTFGSCFAGNIARVLRKFDVDAENITFGEYINSTFANLAYLRWVAGETISDKLGHRLAEIFDQPAESYREKIAKAQLLIITLGVAPAFFELESGEFVLPKASQINMRLFAAKYHFRTTTVDENLNNLKAMVALVRRLSPAVTIVITVSPVPLAVTFEYDSPIVADCVSKSVLRIAADQLMRERIPGIYYWPSFEVVRWVGGYRGDAFGAEDGSTHHVSEQTVDSIIRAFIRQCGDAELQHRMTL
ncbi:MULTISPECIES: GSCFA domain-containing protein [Methylomonas]|uniref:GSCFA domain-containing protein n=1 Tax=Methylomonas TaxID=416 RepID=UPI0012321A5D|nr:GSCFA domain-containing protein [Methylomonas rhizoryzae]